MRCYSNFLWFFGLILFIFSCNLLDRPGNLQSTASAVNAQQTNLAWTVTALAAQTSLGTPLPTRVVLSAEPATPAFPEALSPTIPVIAATTETAPDISDERLLKSAKILLFEDMSASRYIRLVKEALDEAGYFYLDVGSATGWFKSQLLSGVEWDLVIAAAEAEREFGGEFFEFIDAHLERGAAVIIENWDLDSAPMGRVKPMLDRCGVSVQSDWFEPEMRVFFWTDPAHPIFNYPNRITSGLRNAVPLWRGDVGDLLQSNTSAGMTAGNALILAADNGSQANDHGLLVS
jgi:hypothetical protein